MEAKRSMEAKHSIEAKHSAELSGKKRGNQNETIGRLQFYQGFLLFRRLQGIRGTAEKGTWVCREPAA